MRRLKGKCAIVTGAGTGIGEAIAHKFGREGARVLVAGLETDPVLDVCAHMAEYGAVAIPFQGDLADYEQASACVDLAMARFSKIDVLVCNAGSFLATAEAQNFPFDAFEGQLRSNVVATFTMVRAALPYLQRSRGVVLGTGSEAGTIGLPMNAGYAGTKGFMHAFIRSVAAEQAKYGVRANCVCPGPIDTAWTHEAMGPMDKEMEKTSIESTLLGRRGTPEEVANVFAFLASDEASFVTGALYAVDGGITMSKGAIGAKVPRALREEPRGVLSLEHSHDGLRNKNFRKVA